MRLPAIYRRNCWLRLSSVLLAVVSTAVGRAETIVEKVERRNATTRVYSAITDTEVVDPQTGATRTDRRVRQFVEKGSGLCYRDASGHWTPADPAWSGRAGRFEVGEAAYALSAGARPADEVVYTAEGESLRLTPHDIIFRDGDAEVSAFQVDRTAAAAIAPENEESLYFAQAYGSDADLEYEVSPAGFHQNVLLRGLPATPEEFAPKSTTVVVRTRLNLTELLQNGLSVLVNGVPVDVLSRQETEWIKDGQISFETEKGPVFWFADSLVFRGDDTSEIARKRLTFDAVSGGWLLEEELPLSFFQVPDAFPVKWDYVARSGYLGYDEVWKSGDTIYVIAPLTVFAPATLTIEPDCCVKVDNRWDAEVVIATGGLIAKGQPYRPITFTYANDPRCGEIIPGTQFALPDRYLILNPGCDPNWEIEFCRFNFSFVTNLTVAADSARSCGTSSCPTVLRNCVFKGIGAKKALRVTPQGSSSHTVVIENNLFVSDTVPTSSGQTAIDIEAPGYLSFSYLIRNNTFCNWYYAVAMGAYAGTSSTVKQNVFSTVYQPDAVNISTTWQKNGYHVSLTSANDVSPISLTQDPFDTTTAPTIGLYYLNNVPGGGADLRGAGVDTAADVFGPEYERFSFQAPTLLSTEPFPTSMITVKPEEETDSAMVYKTGAESVALGFHAPRIDRYNDRSVRSEVVPPNFSFQVDPGSVVVLDGTSSGGSPKIEMQRARIGGAQPDDEWVTFVDWRNALTVANFSFGGTIPSCTNCFATAHQAISSAMTVQVGGDVTTVRRTRFLWLGSSGIPGVTSTALNVHKTNLPGSEARNLEFYGCTSGLFCSITGEEEFPFTNCLFYRGGNTAVAVLSGQAHFELLTIDSYPIGIFDVGSTGTRITVRNSVFTEITDDPNTNAKEAAIKAREQTLFEDHNAFAQVTYPVVDKTTENARSISERSYDFGNTLPYDRISGRERSVWFLKGRNSQIGLPSAEISLEDGGGALGAEFAADGLSTNRRAIRDDGVVDLGYHWRDFEDTDGDGMASVWEEHFGLDPDDPADAATDIDSDGLTNLTEFLRGTRPDSADSESDLRLGLGADDEEAFVWQYDWTTDFALARDVVDPLRRNEFFFGGNLADLKGTATQRGGPVQTAFGETTASFEWSTEASTTNDGLWVRHADASSYTFHAATNGTLHTVNLTGLQPGSLYYFRPQSDGNLMGRAQRFYTKPDTVTASFETAPYLQNPRSVSATQSEVTVMWRTIVATLYNEVHYREAGVTTWTEVTASSSATDHEVVLQGLKPGKYYVYRVVYGPQGSEVMSGEYSFRALRHDPTEIVVAVHGENRAEGTTEYSYAHGRIAEMILGLPQAPQLDFAVSVGGLYRSGLGPFNEHLWWPARDLMATVPLFPTVGDTEYAGDAGLLQFDRLFDYPAHGVPGQTSHPFYSFDYGPCHFVVLDTGDEIDDTNPPLGHEGGPGIDTQHEWLLNDLALANQQTPRPWICVFLHKPVATDTVEHRWDETQIQNVRLGTGTTFEAFGVDVVFQAQSHAYERIRYSFTDPSATSNVHTDFGVHYVVTGGAGGLPHDVRLTAPTAGVAGRRHGLSTYNACVLSADGDSSLEVRAYELGGPGPLDVLTLTQKWPHPRVSLVDKWDVPANDAYKWKYYDTGTPAASWKQLGYDDSAWSVASFSPDPGLREFGIGDGDEGVVLATGQTTYYFRRRFTLASQDIAVGDVVELRVVVDGGCTVYLHDGGLGAPVIAATVPTAITTGPNERRWHFLHVTALDSASLAGDYMLSAEVEQAPGSSDLSFWAELVVKRPAP